jgi:DNA primase
MRLRQAAHAIQDKELAEAYRQELLERFDAAFGHKSPQGAMASAPRAGRGRYERGAFKPPPPPTTVEAKAAASRLGSRPHPLSAAAAKMVLSHPEVLEGHLEQLEAVGFGDPALLELAKEIIRLRLEGDVLDTEALARHLAAKGFSGLLSEVDVAAKRAALTFLDPNLPLAAAKSLWANAFDVLARLSAIEDALASAKARIETRRDMEAIASLKAERDALRRSIGWGTDWTDRPARDG